MKSLKNSVSNSHSEMIYFEEIEVGIQDFFINGILAYLSPTFEEKKSLIPRIRFLDNSHKIKMHEFYLENPIKESSSLSQEFSPRYFSRLLGDFKI